MRRLVGLLGVLGALPCAALAQQSELDQEAGQEATREADLFGGGPTTPDTKPIESTPDAPPAGLSPLASLRDTLEVGGRLLSRIEGYFFEDQDLADQPLSTPQLLDLYFDARPSDRVRAFARLRFEHDPTRPVLGAGVSVPRVDQMWIKADWDRRVFFTMGQQTFRWGVSRIWNPTDYARSARRDSLAALDLRLGIPAARARVPIEAIGGAFVVAALFDRAETVGQVGGAARLEASAGRWAASVSATARKDESVRIGGDWSSDVAGLFDVRLEGSVARGDAVGWRLDGGEITRSDRDADWIPTAVLGAEWSAETGGITLGVEYFFNDAGQADPDLYDAQLADGMDALYLGRHYGAAYWVWANPGSLRTTSFVLTTLANLGDQTGIARLNVSHRAQSWLYIEPFVSGHFGPRGGELRRGTTFENPLTNELVAIPPPIAQAGLWLRVVM